MSFLPVLGKPLSYPKPGRYKSRVRNTLPSTLQREEPAGIAEGFSESWGSLSLKGSSEGTLAMEIYLCSDLLASSPRSPPSNPWGYLLRRRLGCIVFLPDFRLLYFCSVPVCLRLRATLWAGSCSREGQACLG